MTDQDQQPNVEITVLHYTISCIILNLPPPVQKAILSDMKRGLAHNAAKGNFRPAGIRHLQEFVEELSHLTSS